MTGRPTPSYHGASFADVAGPAAFVTYIRAILLRDTGAAISPFNAFILLQGVETLSLRIDRHIENTKKVVEFLSNHPLVEKVNHPSLPEHPDHRRPLRRSVRVQSQLRHILPPDRPAVESRRAGLSIKIP